MNRNYDFGELAQALSLSRQADNVVLALAKIEHARELTQKDQAALQFAIRFLQEVDSGSRWVTQDRPTINPESARSMSSFVRAAESLSGVQSFDRLLDNITELLNSAEAAGDGKAQPEQLRALRSFFGRILNNTLDQVDRSFVPTDSLLSSV